LQIAVIGRETPAGFVREFRDPGSRERNHSCRLGQRWPPGSRGLPLLTVANDANGTPPSAGSVCTDAGLA